MGTGKTALGRAMAELMQRPFLDSDRLIEDAYRRNARQLAADEGVPELHRIELAVFRSAIETPQASVIAAAASIADNLATLLHIATTHTLVYLDDPASETGQDDPASEHRRPVAAAEAMTLAARRRGYAVEAGASLFPIDHDRSMSDSLTLLANLVGITRSSS